MGIITPEAVPSVQTTPTSETPAPVVQENNPTPQQTASKPATPQSKLQQPQKAAQNMVNSIFGAGFADTLKGVMGEGLAINGADLPASAKSQLMKGVILAAFDKLMPGMGKMLKGVYEMFEGMKGGGSGNDSFAQSLKEFEGVTKSLTQGLDGMKPEDAAKTMKDRLHAQVASGELKLRGDKTLDDIKAEEPFEKYAAQKMTKGEYDHMIGEKLKAYNGMKPEVREQQALAKLDGAIDNAFKNDGKLSGMEKDRITAQIDYNFDRGKPPVITASNPAAPVASAGTPPAVQTTSGTPVAPAILSGGTINNINSWRRMGSTTDFGGFNELGGTVGAFNGDPLSTKRDPNEPSLGKQFEATKLADANTAVKVDPKSDPTPVVAAQNYDQTLKPNSPGMSAG